MQHVYRGDDETAEAEILGRMTAEEYFARALEAPRDARKAELIDGALILFSSPLDIHERLHGFLFHLIREYVDRFDLGEVRGSRSAVKLADDQIYQPDILFVSRDRGSLFERHGIVGAPDLVIEILSALHGTLRPGPEASRLRTNRRPGSLADRSDPPDSDRDPPAAEAAAPAGDAGERSGSLDRAPRLPVPPRMALAGGSVHPGSRRDRLDALLLIPSASDSRQSARVGRRSANSYGRLASAG